MLSIILILCIAASVLGVVLGLIGYVRLGFDFLLFFASIGITILWILFFGIDSHISYILVIFPLMPECFFFMISFENYLVLTSFVGE